MSSSDSNNVHPLPSMIGNAPCDPKPKEPMEYRGPVIDEAVISVKNITPHDFGYLLNEAIRLSERATCYTE